MRSKRLTYLTALAQMLDPMAFYTPPKPHASTCPEVDEKIAQARVLADSERLEKANVKRLKKLLDKK